MLRHTVPSIPLILVLVAAVTAACSPPASSGSRAAAGPGAPAVSREQALEEIRELVRKVNEAYAANDLDAYWSYYAPELTQFYAEGPLDLAGYQAYWNGYIADGNRMTEARVEDLVIHLGPSHDAAIARYRLFTRLAHPDGTTTEEWSQESDVLFRRDGKWQVVHIHYSPAPKEAPAGAAAS